MAEHGAHESGGPTEAELKESVAAGYEIADVSIKVLLQWGIGLGVFVIATAAFGMILFVALQKPPFGPAPLSVTSMREKSSNPPAGTPILQDNPLGDPRADNNPRKGIDNIREFRKDEEIRMSEYATQDGAIQIPLDRAMELGIKDFEAQKSGEAPTGVTPTPEMQIHAKPVEPGPPGGPPPGTAPTNTPNAVDSATPGVPPPPAGASDPAAPPAGSSAAPPAGSAAPIRP